MSRYFSFLCIALMVITTSCVRNSSQTWEDLKTAGRYVGRGLDTLFGNEYESKLLTSDEEFTGPNDSEFIPLRDTDLKSAYIGEAAIPQPKGIPGQRGVPALGEFYAAPDILRAYFKQVHFETDDHVLKETHEIEMLSQMASFLKKNSNVYLVIEGHCDERASASYNLALGIRRANYIRSYLVKQGVDLNRIFTVSRGKEQPLALGHSPEDWRVNRRSEFKIYEK